VDQYFTKVNSYLGLPDARVKRQGVTIYSTASINLLGLDTDMGDGTIFDLSVTGILVSDWSILEADWVIAVTCQKNMVYLPPVFRYRIQNILDARHQTF